MKPWIGEASTKIYKKKTTNFSSKMLKQCVRCSLIKAIFVRFSKIGQHRFVEILRVFQIVEDIGLVYARPMASGMFENLEFSSGFKMGSAFITLPFPSISTQLLDLFK